MTKLLLDRGVDVDAKTGGVSTPLHFAAQNNEPPVADLLLERGAYVGVVDGSGNTPCQLLGENEHFTGHSTLETLCKLLGAAPAPTAAPFGAMPTPAAFNPTPTPVAPGRPSGGAAPDPWQFTESGDTPLHHAALDGSPAEVRRLLDQGADIHTKADMTLRDTSLIVGRWTPLHLAVWWNPDPDVTALLLDRGALIESKTQRGYTPLHGAARYNQFAVVVLLVERGADIKNPNDSGASPLQYATANEDPHVPRLLLDMGADVNHRSNSNTTALHGAAPNSNPAVASLLLDRGAETDINAVNSPGRTPLHYATQLNSNPEVASILVQWGADLQAQDNQGMTPCQLAQKNGAFTGHPVLDFLCAS